MEATQTAPSFETVWAALQETDRIIKESAEQRKEFELEMKESVLNFNRRLGEYINLFGEVTE